MTCNEAELIIQLASDGCAKPSERLRLDEHINYCDLCRIALDETISLRGEASEWARSLLTETSPGDAMNARVLAAIAGKSPGLRRHSEESSFLTIAIASVATALSAYLCFQIHVPMSFFGVHVYSPSFESVSGSLISSIKLLADSLNSISNNVVGTVPGRDIYVALAALVVMNLLVYSNPLRRLRRSA